MKKKQREIERKVAGKISPLTMRRSTRRLTPLSRVVPFPFNSILSCLLIDNVREVASRVLPLQSLPTLAAIL